MTTRELVTPEYAARLLATNCKNRHLSKGTVSAYAQNMKAGLWNENTGVPICIDSNGILRDGQHRLAAVIEAGKSLYFDIRRNVDPNGFYDIGRPRSSRDQSAILYDWEPIYSSSTVHSVIRALVSRETTGKGRRRVTTPEILTYIEENKAVLDGFFLAVPLSRIKYAGSAVVLSMFSAYMAGVSIDKIVDFLELLTTGMSDSPEGYPVIAYRNYVKEHTKIGIFPTDEEIKRCQYALKQYLDETCVKQSRAVKNLIWPVPIISKREHIQEGKGPCGR